MERSKPKPYRLRTQRLTRSELRQIPTPEGARNWKPIGYYELVDTLDQVMQQNSVTLDREEIYIQRGGNLLYAAFDLHRGYACKLPRAKDVTCAVGLVSSLNRRIGVQVIAGVRVLSNDNLLFSPDHIGLKKRHTKRTKLREILEDGFEDLVENYKVLLSEIQRLKDTSITESQARLLIFEIFYKELLPVKLMRRVTKDYTGGQRDLKPGNLWSLLNAVAIPTQQLPPGRKFTALKDLAKIFHRIAEE